MMVPASPALMYNYATNHLMAVPPGVVDRDRMALLKSMVVHGATMFVHKGDVPAVTVTRRLIPHAETNIVRAIPRPGSIEMVR